MKTTDNLKEVFDIVDENDQVIGKATRSDVHQNKNYIHRSIGIMIFNHHGEIFFQQRSATKDTDPLKWTISCSGHVLAGEDAEIAVRRELFEELGVRAALKKVKKYLWTNGKESEMVSLYKGKSEGPFQLNRKEIETGMFLGRKKLTALIINREIKLSDWAQCALEKIGWKNAIDN